MITGVILNWKRPGNVARILAGWRAGGLVSEAIVWNNNVDKLFPPHEWARVINAMPDLGLYTRFAAACLASNDAVLIQDDDLELSVDSLRRLHDAWQHNPSVLHGVFGRKPKSDGSYARNVDGNEDCPVVLTRVLLAHRRYAATFFLAASHFAELQQDGRPTGNGEDIIFSYVVRRCSGRMNRVHRLAVKELPAPHSIHGRDWKGHIAYRTRLLRACEAWLKGERNEVDCDLLQL